MLTFYDISCISFVCVLSGYKSYRLTTEGTWFIQSLVEVFKTYACTDNVVKLLQEVSASIHAQ